MQRWFGGEPRSLDQRRRDIVERARWRPRADDPRGALGWFWREADAPHRYLAGRFAECYLITAFLTLGTENWGFCFIYVALFLLFRRLEKPLWLRKRATSEAISHLIPIPHEELLFPCQIELFQDGLFLGRDQGVVTFVDGWLHYEGLRTNFSLRRLNVKRIHGQRLILASGGEVRFFVKDTFFVAGSLLSGLRWRFHLDLERWDRHISPDGSSRPPPRSIDRTGIARAQLTMLTASIWLGLMLPFLSLGNWRTVAGALPFLIGFLVATFRLYQAYRLKRKEPIVQ